MLSTDCVRYEIMLEFCSVQQYRACRVLYGTGFWVLPSKAIMTNMGWWQDIWSGEQIGNGVLLPDKNNKEENPDK